MIRKVLCLILLLQVVVQLGAQQLPKKGYTLIWSDEFDQKGHINEEYWRFEEGFIRNNEDQWYQKENAYIKDGILTIEARKEIKPHINYNKNSKHWANSRSAIKYTSSSINTSGKHSWQYGIFEMRARIPVGSGLWPAFWTLGIDREWPSNGEIDIMEYYKGNILANIASGTDKKWKAKWHSKHREVTTLGGKEWANRFHVWSMYWDENQISLYVDSILMNRVELHELTNSDGTGFNPFKQPHYILLNLALGGINGGPIDETLLPAKYEIDYVRVYQKSEKLDEMKPIESFTPGKLWMDEGGNAINAHGGGVLYHEGRYYWYGEKRGGIQSQGVNVYSSTNLHDWKLENLAFSPSDDKGSEVEWGCIIERPKVIYNKDTKKFVMWFHLELKGLGYAAARAAVAVSDFPQGPFKLVSSFRPNGHMSRDMGLFVDDDGTAYHIYSSDENYELRLAKLTKDYLTPTQEDKLLFRNHREAPALFKYNNKYYLFTSGCTGWAPNRAELHVADHLFGPWVSLGDPMSGPHSAVTFDSQSTFVLPVVGIKDAFIFMADRWRPNNLLDSRYVWLPINLQDGRITVSWKDSWALHDFSSLPIDQ